MESEQQTASTIIDLDDPVPRGTRIVLAVVLLLIVALLVAALVIESSDAEMTAETPTSDDERSELRACRPTFDVPEVLEPVAGVAMPSWARLCDWIIEPVVTDPDLHGD